MPMLEVSDDGMLHVPGEMLTGALPHARFELERVGQVTVLRPAGTAKAESPSSDAAQRAAAFRQWVESPHPPAPDLPAESLRREYLYE